MKKIKKVYCDTSVIGGVADREFAEATNRFLSYVRAGLFNLVLSPIVDNEIDEEETPDAVKEAYAALLETCDIVTLTQEALTLQKAYLDAGILKPKWEYDALHVALASVNDCDLIVSWNFKHIVNYRKIPLYNAVNRLNGYREIQIFSPLELEESDE